MQALSTMKVTLTYHDFQTWRSTAIGMGMEIRDDYCYPHYPGDERVDHTIYAGFYDDPEDHQHCAVWYSSSNLEGEVTWQGVLFASYEGWKEWLDNDY